MAAKLKVFTWSDGFHAFTVAASSRPKALEAWGVEQDLFKTGLAHEASESPDRDAALASPGAVISRGLSVDIGEATTKKARPSNAKARERLKALEAEVEALDAKQAGEIKVLHDRRATLDQDRKRLETVQGRMRSELIMKLKAARAAAS